MPKYVILCNPGHNRVYFEAQSGIAEAELELCADKIGALADETGGFADETGAEPQSFADIRRENIADIQYLTFSAAAPLAGEALTLISGLSFVYAIFEATETAEGMFLKPVARQITGFMDESVSSILKYTGKTNELFTRMLINAAAFSQAKTGRLRMLDPVMGKGTSLYEGLIKGYDVCGIEIADTVVNEAYHFLKRFLETGKYKHGAETIRVSGPNRAFTATKHTFNIAPSKEAQKSGGTREAVLVAGNSIHAETFFRKNHFDIIVGDLPYGVQHGNVTNEKQSSLTRNPTELLAACLPSWRTALKPGGAMALAWNSNVLPRGKMAELLAANGFAVFEGGAYERFSHRVDQAITRDVVVGRKEL